MSGASALAVVITRPGTRGRCGSGLKKAVSTPLGTTAIRSRGIPISVLIASLDAPETVSRRGRRLVTRFCIRTKPYQRRSERRRRRLGAAASSVRRSIAMGWWTVARTGRNRLMARSP